MLLSPAYLLNMVISNSTHFSANDINHSSLCLILHCAASATLSIIIPLCSGGASRLNPFFVTLNDSRIRESIWSSLCYTGWFLPSYTQDYSSRLCSGSILALWGIFILISIGLFYIYCQWCTILPNNLSSISCFLLYRNIWLTGLVQVSAMVFKNMLPYMSLKKIMQIMV